MTPAICAAATVPLSSATMLDTTGEFAGDENYVPTASLTDVRDGSTYTVSRLADGKCWMTKDLTLALSSTKALTSGTTDLNSKSSWTPENSTQTSEGTVWNADTTARSYHDSTSGSLYNWYAATAGSASSTDSICPKGWRLPQDNEYQELVNKMQISQDANGVKKLLSAPTSFAAHGIYDRGHGTVNNYGSKAWYWQGTAASRTNADNLMINISTGETKAADNSNMQNGMTVRCVAR